MAAFSLCSLVQPIALSSAVVAVLGMASLGISEAHANHHGVIDKELMELLNSAKRKSHASDYKGTISVLNKAIKKYPDCLWCYIMRYKTKEKLNDIPGFLADLTKAVELQPNASNYHLIALEKTKYKDYPGAISASNKAIDINPNFAPALGLRGFLKLTLGDQKGGCPDIKKASNLGDISAKRDLAKYCK